MTDSIPSRAFVPNEANLYARLQALPAAVLAMQPLIKSRLIAGEQQQAQLTFLGIPHLPTGIKGGTAPRILVEKENVLKALGTTDFVRAAFALSSGKAERPLSHYGLVQSIRQLQITSQSVGGSLFVRRADLLQALARRPAPAPVPVPASAPPSELVLLQIRCDEISELLERVSGAQAILFKELQVLRKGMDVLVKELLGAPLQ